MYRFDAMLVYFSCWLADFDSLYSFCLLFKRNGTLTGFLTLNNKGLQEILTQESHDTSNTLGCETDFQPPENSNYCWEYLNVKNDCIRKKKKQLDFWKCQNASLWLLLAVAVNSYQAAQMCVVGYFERKAGGCFCNNNQYRFVLISEKECCRFPITVITFAVKTYLKIRM